MVNSSALLSQSQNGGSMSDGGNRGGHNGRGDHHGGQGTGTGRGQGQQHLYGQSHIFTSSLGAFRICHYRGKFDHIQKFIYNLHGRPRQKERFANVASRIDFSSLPRSFEGKVIVMSNKEFERYNQFQNL